MTKVKILVATILVATMFVSCKNEQDKKVASLTDNYVKFVDSISNLKQELVLKNWDSLQEYNEQKSTELNFEIDKLENKSKHVEVLNLAVIKFEDCSKMIESLKQKHIAELQSINDRKAMFGKDFDGDETTFKWVNKNNILTAYTKFVKTVSAKKDSYSREDWDRIKILSEALDARKNTVENEGLTGSDNRKIALLKIEFASMFVLNRMGAKSEENEEVKK